MVPTRISVFIIPAILAFPTVRRPQPESDLRAISFSNRLPDDLPTNYFPIAEEEVVLGYVQQFAPQARSTAFHRHRHSHPSRGVPRTSSTSIVPRSLNVLNVQGVQACSSSPFFLSAARPSVPTFTLSKTRSMLTSSIEILPIRTDSCIPC